MTTNKDFDRLDIKIYELGLKSEFQSICSQLGITMTDLVTKYIKKTIEERQDLLAINYNSNDNRKEMLNSVSIVEQYERDQNVSLPTEFVKYDNLQNIVLFDRMSHVKSLNKLEEAYHFAMGLLNEIDNLPKNYKIVFTETDDKGRISTKISRNAFGIVIVFILLSAMDQGHRIFTYTDDYNEVYFEDLIALMSEGISTSIHERTKVYDGLFYEKYNSSHYSQWLQWSFGLSRRDPIKEFNRILRKNSKIAKPLDEFAQNELQIRTKRAIELLTKRAKLFNLSEEGLELAIQKINKFTELYDNYAYDYNPTKLCKNAQSHDLFIIAKRKCPLKCGLKVNTD